MRRMGLRFLVVVWLQPLLFATDFFIATNGNDQNPGTQSQPWKTWAFALQQLSPGDTLIAKDGIYDVANGAGFPSIDCSGDYANGTVADPITVKAENERQAIIFKESQQGDLPAFDILHCSDWVIQGLTLMREPQNDVVNGGGQLFRAVSSDHLTIRRLLSYQVDTWECGAGIYIFDTTNSLIEENEIYAFHRHGLQLRGGTNNEIRRNYAHNRGVERVSSACSDESTLFLSYTSGENIWENNIAENDDRHGFGMVSDTVFDLDQDGIIDGNYVHNGGGNKWLGNISLNSETTAGLILGTKTPYGGADVEDEYVENHVAYQNSPVSVPGHASLMIQSPINVMFKNITSIQSTGCFWSGTDSQSPDNAFSLHGENLLCIRSQGGSEIALQPAVRNSDDTWSIDYLNWYRDLGEPVWPPSEPGFFLTNDFNIDPQMGGCVAWIPTSSPMKGAGKGGADLGANVLYKYEDGILGSDPLWDWDGSFLGCGAIVSGLNDSAGESCFDVHERLNINTGGCDFPAGYNPSGDPVDRADLLAHWTFDSAQAVDSSGNENDGVLLNGTSWTSAGKVGGALSFDGQNDLVEVSGASFDGTGEITVAAWINRSSTGGHDSGRILDNTRLTFSVGRNASRLHFTSSGGGTKSTPVGSLQLDEWQHVAVTRDAAGNADFFINGVKIDGGFSGTPVARNYFAIGNYPSPGGTVRPFAGLIDDLRVYSRRLLDWEIQALHNNDPAGGPPFDFSLSFMGATSVTQGSTASQTIISALISGLGESVTFSIESLPPNTTASFSPPNCVPDCSTNLDIVTSTTTPAGNYDITVNGASGALTRSISFNLTVEDSDPTGSDADLLAHWTFDSAQAVDSSGNENDGVLLNGTSWTSAGKVGGALSFDGQNDLVEVSGASFDGTGEITVAAWINRSSTGGHDSGRILDNTRLTFSVGRNASRLHFTSSGGGTKSTPVGSLQLDEWQHVAVTRDAAGNADFFINGVKIDGGFSGTPVVRTYFAIGNYPSPGGTVRPFAGLIDDLRVYSRRLLDSEIQAIYNNNQAPNSVINTPIGPQTIGVGNSVNFTGTGTDPDNNLPLTHLWNFGAGSGIANSTAEDPGAMTFDTAGVFTVTYMVTDALLLADPTPATVQITVQVSGNHAPNGVINTPIGPQTIGVGNSVNFIGTGTDPDNNLPLTHLWNFGAGSGIANSTAEDPGAMTFDTAGVFTVTYMVTDALLLADPTPATVQITVQNSSVPNITNPIPTSTLTNSTVTFQWTAGSGVDSYWLGVGTSQASLANNPWGDISSQSTTSTSLTVSGIPINGNPVYVRLWWNVGSTWFFTDYTYQTN